MPIFFFASVSVVLFYLTSQKALRPDSWWKEILYLPLLLALGIGMSINNAKAVLEAIFNHQSGFVRTPKYGIDQGSSRADWRRSSYRAMKTLTPVVELLFGFFFVFVLVDAVDERPVVVGDPVAAVPRGVLLHRACPRWPGCCRRPARPAGPRT